MSTLISNQKEEGNVNLTTKPPPFAIIYTTVYSLQFRCTIFSTLESMVDIKLDKNYYES